MAESGAPAAATITVQELTDFCVEAMRRAGINEEDARLTADVLVTTDLMGTFTHGTRQLRGLLKNVRTGRLNAAAHEEIIGEGPGWAIVHAHHALPPAVSYRCMELAIRKARACGIAYAGVQHSSHFGAAGYYAVQAARQDMIGLAFCNVDPGVTAPGSRGRVMGTNPIAYAAPAGEERPVFLDIATSAVAASKLYAAQALGKPIPDTWMVDDDGLPTTDPAGYPNRGALLPMAGHKGYGLAVLVEILSAVLTGAAMLGQVKSWIAETPEPCDEGHAFIAIDVGQIMPLADFRARMDWMIREIKSAPLAEGATRIWLPGEMEWERRDAGLANGIELPPNVVASLCGLAADVGLSTEQLFQHEG